MQAGAGFDVEKLNTRVDLKLSDASMTDAAAGLAKLAGVEIAAPADVAEDGLYASLKQQTLRDVLNALTKMTGLRWYVENTVIVFRKPETPAQVPPAPTENLTPEEGMTTILGSLNDSQLLFVSRGMPLSYGDLTPFQQDILGAMLSPPAVGIADSGTVIKSLPKPEETILSFWTMPSLAIPKTAGGEALTLRLDSAPYMHLKKPAEK